MSDREYLHISWHFFIAGTDEIAITGLNFSAELTFDAEAALAEIDMAVLGPVLLNSMATLVGPGPIFWADYSFLDFVRVAAVGQDGLEIGDAKLFEDLTTRQGTSQVTLPQSSVVVSTRSTFRTGSANFGRMYLPHTALQLATGQARASAGTTSTIATRFQTFLLTVETALDVELTDDVEPWIITHIAGNASKEVLEVAVGDVTDTQRRRRNQLPEVYAVRSIP